MHEGNGPLQTQAAVIRHVENRLIFV